ncbi:MAG: hypothetical protein KC535_05960 [Nanoarchaeota archaeon]|nr:hypothetical protein [Nanoarchaeota archaeon]
MAVFSFFKKLLSNTFLSGLEHAVKDTMHEAGTRAEEIIDHAEERATRFMHNLIKGTILFFLGLVGFIFAMVGFGSYLSQTVDGLDKGLGFILLGAVMLILAGFAHFMQKE